MRPPAGYDRFDPRNVQIHGIREHQVATAPRFGELFAQIGEFIGGDTVIAHNAAFDMGVIRSALEVSGLPGPGFDYACTVILSRRSYNLVSYSLPFVAEAAGVPLLNHHDAVEDARACAGIMIDIATKNNAGSLADLFAAMKLAASRFEPYAPGQGTLSKSTRAAQLADSGSGGPYAAVPPGERVPGSSGWARWPEEGANPQADPAADPAHPLYGQTIVFTGNLGLTRSEAKRRAAELGAQPASGVTRKTTVLVVGDGFAAADLKSARLTTKARKVLALHERGQRIEVLSEGEFLQMIGGTWPAAAS